MPIIQSLDRALKIMDQNEETGKFKLGLKVLEKGQLVLRHLEALSARTGQTTHLVIIDGNEGVYR